jgi:hypothetical protein
MATASKTKTTEAVDLPEDDEAPGSFQILDEAPVFRSRRAKSALRLAMEGLEVGQSMTTGFVTSDARGKDQTKEDKNMLSKVRQRTQQISRDEEFPGYKYSVRVDVENRIIVTRVA